MRWREIEGWKLAKSGANASFSVAQSTTSFSPLTDSDLERSRAKAMSCNLPFLAHLARGSHRQPWIPPIRSAQLPFSLMLSVAALVPSSFTLVAPAQRHVMPAVASAASPAAALLPTPRFCDALMMADTATVPVEQIHQDADAVFSVIDKDGNGSISADELTTHLVSCGYKPEAVKKIFATLDTDGDGELSREELRAGMVNYTPLRKAPGLGNYNAECKKAAVLQTAAEQKLELTPRRATSSDSRLFAL